MEIFYPLGANASWQWNKTDREGAYVDANGQVVDAMEQYRTYNIG
jgi:hypothetical protein